MLRRSPLLGYNHNIRYAGRLFHVQTEDSGTQNPHIYTHLFSGGSILATKRADYEPDADAQVVQKKMQAMHKAMLLDLRAGKLDEQLSKYFGEPMQTYEPADSSRKTDPTLGSSVTERQQRAEPEELEEPAVVMEADEPLSDEPYDGFPLEADALPGDATLPSVPRVAPAGVHAASSAPAQFTPARPTPTGAQPTRPSPSSQQVALPRVPAVPPPPPHLAAPPPAPSAPAPPRPYGDAHHFPRWPRRSVTPAEPREPIIARPTVVVATPTPPRPAPRPTGSQRARPTHDIFGEPLDSARSLDEAILHYLAEEMDK